MDEVLIDSRMRSVENVDWEYSTDDFTVEQMWDELHRICSLSMLWFQQLLFTAMEGL